MPTITQKYRPILMVLQDTSGNHGWPLPYLFYTRPEELTIIDPSRTTVHQTLGGAWADGFGIGLEQIQIAGNTGWGQGWNPPGELAFHLMYNVICKRWHQWRLDNVQAGIDPDLVKPIFIDTLDLYWGIAIPMSFTLKRSRSRPLLFLYNVNLIMVSTDIASFAPGFASTLTSITTGITGAITKVATFAASLI